MYKIRSDRPVNPVIIEILLAVHTVSQKLGHSYFLVGATARDILMSHVFGIESRRATHDVDFAITLETWDRFHEFKNALVATGSFESATDKQHLLYYKPAAHDNAFPLDLIPFGGVEREEHQIAWPPDMKVLMNVTAYAEALRSALDVDVGNGLIVRVISIPALAALKLLAWDDRGLQDNKDAQDLFFLLQHYHEAGNADRMYEDAYELLEACGFDLPLAGATLLGYDASTILYDTSLHALLAILGDLRKRDRLIIHMTRSTGTESETADKLLSQFELGLQRKKTIV